MTRRRSPSPDGERPTVRASTADDWETVRRLRLAALRDAPDAFSAMLENAERQSAAFWKRRAAAEELPARVGLLAFAEDVAVGMALCIVDSDDATTADVFGMWVAPEARRDGCAAALLAAVVDWARTHDVRTLRLGVTEGNLSAYRLYERHGFAATGATEPLREGSLLRVHEMHRAV